MILYKLILTLIFFLKYKGSRHTKDERFCHVAEYERENILNFVRCKSMAHMKISIVVLSDNWTAEHFARKSPRNCREYGMILQSVDYVCARVISATVYWIFKSSSDLFNKIISVNVKQISPRLGGVASVRD